MGNTRVQNIFRILLGIFLICAGIAHFTFSRTEFLAQVPKWIPLNGDLVVLLSGLVEIILGCSLIFVTGKKSVTGICAALFFVLVFPGNIAQYVNGIDGFGLDTDNLRLMRLFFQPVLILWALWSTGVFRKENN